MNLPTENQNPFMRNIMEQETKTNEKIIHITQYNSNQRDVFVKVNVDKDFTETDLETSKYHYKVSELLDNIGVEWDGWSEDSGDYSVKLSQHPEQVLVSQHQTIHECSLVEDTDGILTLEYEPEF
jgi:hypothetical protein